MLDIIARGFANAKAKLTGRAALSEANIDEAMREIRVSLLEGDVELNVARTFLERVKARALGEVVELSATKGQKKLATTPGEHFVLICHHELEKLLGPVEEAPVVFRRPYTIIMLVGLQGTGKTTTCGKLSQWLMADQRRPLLVAADTRRPAAVEQLQALGEKLGVPVYAAPGLSAAQLCQDALREAKRKKRDVVIFDTAGRLAIDNELMAELEEIKARTRPDHIFLVVDAMAGQDAVRTASEFNRRLDLSGFILTKLDGDARGGAALSIKEITGKPIKFLGTGETLDKLEPFRPEGLASRILGMGDVVGLMKNFESVIDEKQAERDTKKLLRGEFTLDDFLSQLNMLKKIGSVAEIYEKFPILGEGASVDDKAFLVMESIIQSMTARERREPALIDKKRAQRIAFGSGRKPEQVFELLQRFAMMHRMMANLAAQPGLLGMLPGFKQLSQLRKLKGQNTDDLFDVGNSLRAMARGRPLPMPAAGLMPTRAPAAMPGLPRMGLPGMPSAGLPGMPAAHLPNPAHAGAPGPAGMDAAGVPAMAPGYPGARPVGQRQVDARQKEKSKAKRKAEKAARKKSRRR